MANDRIGQIEREFRGKSEQRDRELNDLRNAIAEYTGEQTALASRVAELSAVVNNLRDVKPPSIAAFWGPSVATIVVVGSLGGFILNERVAPIAKIVETSKNDLKELSGLYGELARRQSANEEKLRWHDKWIDSIQAASTRIDATLANVRVKEAERQ